ncbi:MAG: TIGR02646 family protein [Magnetococcales bacterium]|nr:TIGR02646 family protein [Magnetococcales bacterium]
MNAVHKKEALRIEGSKHHFDNNVYAHATVKVALNAIYHNKCAYCESLIEEQADRRVEHYRPKGGGYHWLAYEWSNLLLACESCNRKKWNHFPVNGSRVAAPPSEETDWRPDSGVMRAEQPLLLNPEIDHPEAHLRFSPDGQIHAVDDSEQGVQTIKYCGLQREDLVYARKKQIDWFRKQMKCQLSIFLDYFCNNHDQTGVTFQAALSLGFQTIAEQIKAAQQPDHPFSRVGWHINNEPETFLLEDIPAGELRDVARCTLKLLKIM